MAKDKAKKLTKRSLPQEVRLTVKASQAKKAEDILVLDLRELSSFTDFFVILTGNSSRQNVAIYENIEQELKKEKTSPLGVEGKELAEWILMDYGSFIIHVFSRRAREYYSLERLWGDAPRVAYAERP
jgi:ribosome-associated protein